VHEATHLNEYQSTGYTSEYKPQEAEKTIKWYHTENHN
jgi:hypothetical protein